jgi:hypothetical protein
MIIEAETLVIAHISVDYDRLRDGLESWEIRDGVHMSLPLAYHVGIDRNDGSDFDQLKGFTTVQAAIMASLGVCGPDVRFSFDDLALRALGCPI